MAETQAAATPLIERLRSIPKDARLTYEHNPTSHSMFPVGLMAHEAADALASSPTAADLDKDAEIARLREALGRLADDDSLTVGVRNYARAALTQGKD